MQSLLFSFNGRIRRSQYWLYGIGVGMVGGVILAVLSILMRNGGAMMYVGGILALIVYVVLVWAGLALGIKRWHDRDKSWVWIFIALIPVIGGIWALVECGFLDGTPGPNRFGPSPKGLSAPTTAPAI